MIIYLAARTAKWSLYTLLLALQLLTSPALAVTFKDGLAASQQGDYQQAAQIWLALAEAGDPLSQFGMGTLYHEGMGVALDLTESTYWFHRASEQGLAEAQYNLGNAYRHGEGVGESDTMAARWWQKAAEQGFAPAQYNLGTALIFGRGVEQDETAGLEWYRKAAAQGHEKAQVSLAEAGVSGEPAPPPPAPVARSKPVAPPAAATPPPPASEAALPSEWTARKPAPKPAPKPTPAVAGPCGEWLAAQPARHYTMQLMATVDGPSAARFARRMPDNREKAVCSYPRDGKQWYSVLYGSYPSVAAAKEAQAELPEKVRASGPWIRRFGPLQKLVNGTQ